MTAQPFIHGKGEPRREHPSGVETRSANNGGPYAGDDYTFRADDPAGLEYDVFRLDCAVDALKGADISPYRAELARIAHNLADLLLTDHRKDMAA